MKELQNIIKILDLFYKNSKLKTKKDLELFLTKNSIIKQEKRSLFRSYNDWNLFFRFLDNRKGRSNTVLSLKNILTYNKQWLLIGVSLFEDSYELFLFNLPFIEKISHSSNWLTIDNIKGSVNQPNIKKIINNKLNNKDNIFWNIAYYKEFIWQHEITDIVLLNEIIEKTTKIKPNNVEILKLKDENIKNIVFYNSKFNTIDLEKNLW